jgi:predicted RNase H-like HicB family nuclease
VSKDVFDGFMINVFFDEDDDYLVHLVELPNVSAFGATPPEALSELKTAGKTAIHPLKPIRQ